MDRKDWVASIGAHPRWFDFQYWSYLAEMIKRSEHDVKNSRARKKDKK